MDVEKVFGFTTGRSISLPLPPNSVLPLVSRLPFYADGAAEAWFGGDGGRISHSVARFLPPDGLGRLETLALNV